MLSHCTERFIFTLSIIFFLTGVHSQRIRFEEDNWNRPINVRTSCDVGESCIPVRRCRPVRERPNWREAGETCGTGSGSSRRVCCPDRNPRYSPPRQSPTRRPVARQTSRRPEITTRRPERRPLRSNDNAECGESRVRNLRAPYVMGGTDAAEGAWPWMAAIRIRERSGNYNPWCTGFLIDRRHVLSAAHCYDRRQNGLYTARIGAVNQNEGQEYSIVSIVVPEGYRAGLYYNDLAILTLNRDVDVPGFNPICLPDESLVRRNLEGMGTTVAGWGAEQPNGRLSITLKQLSEIPVVPILECNNVFRSSLTSFNRQFPQGITGGFICAGFPEGQKDACGGDSGAPLMFQDRNRWFAVGIVSFGFSCGRPGIPGGYTRISSHLRWIRENLRN